MVDPVGHAGALPPDGEAVAGAGLVGDLLMIPLEPGDYPI